MTLDYIQAFCRFYSINSEMDDFVPTIFKTDIVAGSTITEMSSYLATNPTIYQLFNRLNIFPSDQPVSYNSEPEWQPTSISPLNRTWSVVNCNSTGEDAVPIGTVSTGTIDSLIG